MSQDSNRDRTAGNRIPSKLGVWMVAFAMVATACSDDGTSTPTDRSDTSIDATGDVPSGDATTDTDGSAAVSGRVVTDPSVPGSDTQVGLLGTNATDTTDSDGRFSFDQGQPPYDIVLFNSTDASNASTAFVYRGVTDSSPALFFPRGGTTSSQEADITVTLDSPIPLDEVQLLPEFAATFVPNQPPPARTFTLTTPGTGSTEMTTAWSSRNDLTGRVVIAQLELNSNGRIDDFEGAGISSPLTLQDGDTPQTNVDLGSSPTLSSVSGSITVARSPDSVSHDTRLIRKGRYIDRLADVIDGTQIQRQIVQTDTYNTAMVVRTSWSSQNNVPAKQTYHPLSRDSSGNVTIQVDAPPTLQSPNAGASDIDRGTEFKWADNQNALYALHIESTSDEDDTDLYIVTHDPTTTLPDLSTFGFSLDPQLSYRWHVHTVQPVESIAAVSTSDFHRREANPFDSSLDPIDGDQKITTGTTDERRFQLTGGS